MINTESETTNEKQQLTEPSNHITHSESTTPERSIVLEIITEFIESGVLNDALEGIKKRREIDGAEFVKRTLIFGIEKKAYERELISQLLSGAYSIFQNKEMPEGFEIVLERLPDLSLDNPDAAEALGKFIARAIFDEVLPPVFIQQAKANNPKAQGSLSLAQELYDKDRKILNHIWGGGDL
jgi:programmed cell death protein 4